MSLLLQHIPTSMKRVADTNGGEYKGSCPWCGGADRFTVSPEMGESGLYVCRGCKRGGDGIKFLCEREGLSFAEACLRLGLGHKLNATEKPPVGSQRDARQTTTDMAKTILQPPGEPWQSSLRKFVDNARAVMWNNHGKKARAWLHGRGLRDETIEKASLGINEWELWQFRTSLGLPAKENKKDGGKVWIPPGIVIPWVIEDKLWKVNIRRPNPMLKPGDPKYVQVAGTTGRWSTNGLYNADKLRMDQPAILVEGEFDALSLQQEAGDLITAVATGSTEGARKIPWIAKLALCSHVLVSFDTDEAGEKAARYWTDKLLNAKRWRPYWGDVSQMLQEGATVRAWVAAGLGIDGQCGEQEQPEDHQDQDDKASFFDQYAQPILDLWGMDVLGPLACWLLFEVPEVPKNVQITPDLYADRELYQWIREGLMTGPGFEEKNRLRSVLLALYEHIEGKLPP